jgi:3-oxoacyl-[acyl-carrier protein] reductase
MKLAGRVAIITGGGTGIGRATSELFAQEGARVVVNYHQPREAAERTAAGIVAKGGEAIAWKADVTVDAEVRAMMAQVESRWGRLDILVNNAGWTKYTPHHLLDDLTDEIWERTLNVNLHGTFYCSRAAAPLLRKSPGASIVNIASVAPDTGDGSSIVYAASKAGVISMTKSFARVLAPEVRVNAISPGLVDTGFVAWPPETLVAGKEANPLKKITEREEVAAAALFLAADATSTTGEVIRVDCGIVALRRGR